MATPRIESSVRGFLVPRHARILELVKNAVGVDAENEIASILAEIEDRLSLCDIIMLEMDE